MWDCRRQGWNVALKRGFHTDVGDLVSRMGFAGPLPGKTFTNPNFVNANHPKLMPQTGRCDLRPSVAVDEKTGPETAGKRKRKRRRSRKKKDKTAQAKTTEPSMPELTRSFECFSVRGRIPSVCDSEDSFIVFDDRKDDSAVESDGIAEGSTEVSETEGTSSDSCVPHKRVRFASESSLCEVHPMVKWSFAYQAARRGPWEELARDRQRFQNRIKSAEKKLRGVLDPSHRDKIYRQRFKGDD